MGRAFLQSLIFAFAGLLYGLALAGIALQSAGASHGTYVVLGLCSSPLGLVQNIALALFGTPLLWFAIATLLGGARNPSWRAAFLLVMVAQYAALPLVLIPGSTFGDWEYTRKCPGLVTFGAGAYALGQAALWTTFALKCRSLDTPID